jgi:multidrug efflux pump
MIILSIVFIFLILLAQFNSLRSTLVVMSTVPLAIWGSLLFIFLKGSLNVYSVVGLITVIGLITKHGILFINSLPEEGDKIEKAVFAAKTRLRAVLMTTLAMAFGVIPLMFNTEPAMVYLREMANILFPGIVIGTIMTLFVVPSIYYYIGE